MNPSKNLAGTWVKCVNPFVCLDIFRKFVIDEVLDTERAARKVGQVVVCSLGSVELPLG